MRYFSTLPLITQKDPYGNFITVNNLLSRAYLLPSLQNNLMMFYTYDLKESDSPENISYRYYNDVYRYWIVLYSNNIIDSQAQWPLTSQQFIVYLQDKYATAANGAANVLSYTTSNIHHYEQYITTKNSVDNQGQTITIQIDGATYNSFTSSTTTSAPLPDGSVVTKSVTAESISIYDYENKLNESKRSIKIMNSNYVNQTEQQLQSLMK